MPSAPPPGEQRLRMAVEINWSQKEGGARRVAEKLVRELAQHPDLDIHVFNNAENRLFVDTAIRCRSLQAPRLLPQVLWDQFLYPHWALPRALKRLQPDVTLFTNNLMSRDAPDHSLVILHDLTPFVIPETYRWLHGFYQRWYFRQAARKAAYILTVSEHSRNDITHILKVPSKRISVMRLGGDLLTPIPTTDDKPPSHWGIDQEPFILYAGAQHPRKNVERLIQAFEQLKEEQQIPHRLLIVGAARWKKNAALNRAKTSTWHEHIIMTGRISDSLLVQLYQACDAFVYPSLYEGFGLPVLEAMSMGAPVVTSHSSSMAEIAGEAATLVDPLDVNSIAQGIAQLLNDKELAQSMRERGQQRASAFTWKSAAETVHQAIQAVRRNVS